MRIANRLEPRVTAETNAEILVNLALKQLKRKVFGRQRLQNSRWFNHCRSNINEVCRIVGNAAYKLHALA